MSGVVSHISRHIHHFAGLTNSSHAADRSSTVNVKSQQALALIFHGFWCVLQARQSTELLTHIACKPNALHQQCRCSWVSSHGNCSDLEISWNSTSERPAIGVSAATSAFLSAYSRVLDSMTCAGPHRRHQATTNQVIVLWPMLTPSRCSLIRRNLILPLLLSPWWKDPTLNGM